MAYSLSWQQLKLIENFKKSHEHTCVYCGKQIIDKKNDLTVDHILPVSRGGKTEESNLAICCSKCNKDKSDMTKEEYNDYLHKVEELKNNETLISIQNMIEENIKIIIKYNDACKVIGEKTKEKKELEKIILDLNFNAAEGYNLCRDLKNVLIEIDEATKEQSELGILNTYALENKKKLDKMSEDVLNSKIKILRSSLHIGQLGKIENKSA